MIDFSKWVPHHRETWSHPFAVTAKPVKNIPGGARVKIVMVSRMGDVGITTNLMAETGYEARVEHEDLELYSKNWHDLEEAIKQKES